MKSVVVGSKNPVKLMATKEAFETAFPEETFEFILFNASSLVSDQPFGDNETKTGAINRANACMSEHPQADYFVGLEGGLEKDGDKLWACAWMCIKDKAEKTGFGKTGAFLLPSKLVGLINQGKELGDATDLVFSKINSKQAGGAVKILTQGTIDRKDFYFQAMMFALIPFLNPDLY